MNNKIKTLALFIALFTTVISSCKKNNDAVPDPGKATMQNLEIGSGNNAQGVIGRDFHFEMDVVAASRISDVQVQIKQKAGQTYTKPWTFEIKWNEFKGVKNTTVHKHFDIDKEAPEGTYDFIIRVTDENGSVAEAVHSIKLIKPENLPINPEIYSLMVEKADKGFVYVLNVGYPDANDKGFKKGEKINSYNDISNVKGDGIMYTFLIKKSTTRLPETVKEIDFNKAIVIDVREHKNMIKVDYFTNYLPLEGQVAHTPKALVIGASMDNLPAPSPIAGDKAWSNGDYYLGVVYTNTTYQMSVNYYVDLKLTGF